jgi:hypothetical protein
MRRFVINLKDDGYQPKPKPITNPFHQVLQPRPAAPTSHLKKREARAQQRAFWQGFSLWGTRDLGCMYVGGEQGVATTRPPITHPVEFAAILQDQGPYGTQQAGRKKQRAGRRLSVASHVVKKTGRDSSPPRSEPEDQQKQEASYYESDAPSVDLDDTLTAIRQYAQRSPPVTLPPKKRNEEVRKEVRFSPGAKDSSPRSALSPPLQQLVEMARRRLTVDKQYTPGYVAQRRQVSRDTPHTDLTAYNNTKEECEVHDEAPCRAGALTPTPKAGFPSSRRPGDFQRVPLPYTEKLEAWKPRKRQFVEHRKLQTLLNRLHQLPLSSPDRPRPRHGRLASFASPSHTLRDGGPGGLGELAVQQTGQKMAPHPPPMTPLLASRRARRAGQFSTRNGSPCAGLPNTAIPPSTAMAYNCRSRMLSTLSPIRPTVVKSDGSAPSLKQASASVHTG